MNTYNLSDLNLDGLCFTLCMDDTQDQTLELYVLREPFMLASTVLRNAPWGGGSYFVPVPHKAPASVWIWIVQTVLGQTPAGPVPADESLFETIDYLDPDPCTAEGQALIQLSSRCPQPTSNGIRTASVKSTPGSFRRASVSFSGAAGTINFAACGYAMASASRSWKRQLPNIDLDGTIAPESVWYKLLSLVHRGRWPTLLGPRHTDAESMGRVLQCLDPDERDPIGRILLDFQYQCQVYEHTRLALQEIQPSDGAGLARVILKSDRTCVAHLDAGQLKAVLTSAQFGQERTVSYQLLLDWLRYHGPGPEHMSLFMRENGLENIRSWTMLPTVVRDEAISMGILHDQYGIGLCPSKSFPLSRTIAQGRPETVLVDGRNLVVFNSTHVFAWDIESSKLIKSFSLDGDKPTLLCGNFLATYTNNSFGTGHITLWNIYTGEVAAHLRYGQSTGYTPKAQRHHYIISRSPAEMDEFKNTIGCWGNSGFGGEYKFLRCFRAQSVPASHGSHLFIYNHSRGIISHFDLDANALVRTIHIGKSFPPILRATSKYLICGTAGRVHLYRYRCRNMNERVICLDKTITNLVASDKYLVCKADDFFEVWDMDKASCLQRINVDYRDRGNWNIGFDGQTLALVQTGVYGWRLQIYEMA